MIEQAVTITPHKITIAGHLFVHKDYSMTKKELLFDVLSMNYIGQKIHIFFWDGENTQFSNFIDCVRNIRQYFNIPLEQITIESHDPHTEEFEHIPMSPGIFHSTGSYLPDNFVHDYANGKFVGALLGRFNPTRLRLAYSIDHAFPNDNFVVFQPKLQQVQHEYRHFMPLYQQEMDWLENKTFDVDMQSTHHSGMIDWPASTKQYPNVCNQYQIEIISETDAFSDFWVTEKTARCLAIGKPFVLISGTGSLQNLKSRGFNIFDEWLNPEYDRAVTPTWRINMAMNMLKDIYDAPDREDIIQQLYHVAAKNKQLYKEYIKAR